MITVTVVVDNTPQLGESTTEPSSQRTTIEIAYHSANMTRKDGSRSGDTGSWFGKRPRDLARRCGGPRRL